MDENYEQTSNEKAKKGLVNGTQKNKKIIMICGIIFTIALLVVIGIAIVVGNSNSQSNSKSKKTNSKKEYYEFIVDSKSIESEKCFDVTLAEFIDCYNAYQKKEYGEYGEVLKKVEFDVDGSNGKATEYKYVDNSVDAIITLIVENDSEKIISIEYTIIGKDFKTEKDEEYCNSILSFATNEELSWKRISNKMDFNNEDEVFFNENLGNTVYDKGIMYFKNVQIDDGDIYYTVYGMLPMTEEYYKEEVCDNGNDKGQEDESDDKDISDKYLFIEDTEISETGKRFNVTFEKFYENYNEYFCERGMSEEYYGTTPDGMKDIDYDLYEKNIGRYEFDTNGTEVIEKITVYVEDDTDKILAVECTFNTAVMVANFEWTYNMSDDILSLATDRHISQADMKEVFSSSEYYEISKEDSLGWFRYKDGVMYYDCTTFDKNGSGKYTTYGIVAMDEDYYNNVICGNSDAGVGE